MTAPVLLNDNRSMVLFKPLVLRPCFVSTHMSLDDDGRLTKSLVLFLLESLASVSLDCNSSPIKAFRPQLVKNCQLSSSEKHLC